jgi:hypothetical protein
MLEKINQTKLKVQGINRTRNILYKKYLKVYEKFKKLSKYIFTWENNAIKNPKTLILEKNLELVS